MYQIVVLYRDVLTVGRPSLPVASPTRIPGVSDGTQVGVKKPLGVNRSASVAAVAESASLLPRYSSTSSLFAGKKGNSATAATEASGGDVTHYAEMAYAPSLNAGWSVGAATGATGSGGAVQNRHSFS
jgi:hypothetical protein